MLEKMHGTSFDWLSWTGCGLLELEINNRKEIIINNIPIIKKYAIGYCPAEQLICRPKINEIAVMFLKEDKYFWTHFTKKEFLIVFNFFVTPQISQTPWT
ncbi:MAG: hypothetical protein PHP92_03305 [Candidatus Nanoarchaeia archaeon]|nr:hypothetical protein [Candidatus Nanoarchaeia archaeon]